METIEINSSNYKDFQNLDIIGLSFAHIGAQGEGGGINIMTLDGKLYHTNICHSIKYEEILQVCPILKDCHFNVFEASEPKGWVSFYMGGGNFLVIRERFEKIISKIPSYDLYNKWEILLSQVSVVPQQESPLDVKHKVLVSTYMYNKFLNGLSFKERIDMDLGNTLYNIKTHSDTYNNISCEELSIMLTKLKKPWWNNLYERIKGNKKVLLIINLLLNIKFYKFQAFKLLYKVIKTK